MSRPDAEDVAYRARVKIRRWLQEMQPPSAGRQTDGSASIAAWFWAFYLVSDGNRGAKSLEHLSTERREEFEKLIRRARTNYRAREAATLVFEAFVRRNEAIPAALADLILDSLRGNLPALKKQSEDGRRRWSKFQRFVIGAAIQAAVDEGLSRYRNEATQVHQSAIDIVVAELGEIGIHATYDAVKKLPLDMGGN